MAEIDDRLAQLQARLENLVKYQEYFYREISQLTVEIKSLQEWRDKVREAKERLQQPAQPLETKSPVRDEISWPVASQPTVNIAEPGITDRPSSAAAPSVFSSTTLSPEERSDFEKFIGENLISKIGIVVLVIGVAIGGKYAIDHNLISPWMRILFGYLVGGSLVFFAIRLKPKYHDFSAVLMSGAMTIWYFITHFATGIFGLVPPAAAFAVMLMLTVATVVSALRYDRQIIAHLGLVGAYLIPFLLGGDSGNYIFFFVYIAIINTGILAVSIRKYWKEIFYTSFVFTWLIFAGWSVTKYNATHFELAFVFLTIYFLIFYFTFIIHRLVYRESLSYHNIGLTLANAAVFYGGGLALLNSHGYQDYFGLFTLINAAIHFVFAVLVSRVKDVHKDILYLLSALVLTFVTITIPVELDGHWVTVLWLAEAVILFVIGRRKQIPLYEIYSYPVMMLAGASLLNDWGQIIKSRTVESLATNPYPILNINFLITLMAVAAAGIIFYIDRDEEFESAATEDFRRVFGYVMAAVGLLLFYNAFRGEIANYFYYRLALTAVHEAGGILTDENLMVFSILWQINYTMLFLTVLSFVNIRYLRNSLLAAVNVAFNFLALPVFLLGGLVLMAKLQESYLAQEFAQYFYRGAFNIQIRYISYAFLALIIFACYRYVRQDLLEKFDTERQLPIVFDVILHIALLVIASYELISWMRMLGRNDGYKFGLSLLWGIYALSLIGIGIYYRKKHLRIMAMSLFALTLAKLFAYDIAELDTISKTLLFVSVGILLLVASFLYNKYKHFLFPEEGDDEALEESS